MRRLAFTNASIAVVFFAIQISGAFIIGATILGRYEGDAEAGAVTLPASTLAGAVDTMVAVAIFITAGFIFRYFSYRKIDGSAQPRGMARMGILVGEALYAVVNLWLVWIATEPVGDGSMLWILVVGSAFLVTVLSITLFASLPKRGRGMRGDVDPMPN